MPAKKLRAAVARYWATRDTWFGVRILKYVSLDDMANMDLVCNRSLSIVS